MNCPANVAVITWSNTRSAAIVRMKAYKDQQIFAWYVSDNPLLWNWLILYLFPHHFIYYVLSLIVQFCNLFLSFICYLFWHESHIIYFSSFPLFFCISQISPFRFRKKLRIFFIDEYALNNKSCSRKKSNGQKIKKPCNDGKFRSETVLHSGESADISLHAQFSP